MSRLLISAEPFETPAINSALGPSKGRARLLLRGAIVIGTHDGKTHIYPVFSDYKLIFNITKHNIYARYHPCLIWRYFRHMWYVRRVNIELGGIPSKPIFGLVILHVG